MTTAVAPRLFDHFSFSSLGVPSVARVKSAMDEYKEAGGFMETTEWLDDRYVTILKDFQPQWLKSMVRKIRMEFPGGFPDDHFIHALLLEVKPGAGEQKMHSDGGEGSLFWNIIVPLSCTNEMQGTTVFENGTKPSRWCRNYMFDSNVLHYGQANRSRKSRYALLFIVSTTSYWF